MQERFVHEILSPAFVAILSVVVAAQPADPVEAALAELKSDLGVAQWPGKHDAFKGGFCFEPSDYPALAALQIVGDLVELDASLRGVVRRVRLQSSLEEIGVTVIVARNAIDDAHQMLVEVAFLGDPSNAADFVRPGDALGISVGSTCLVPVTGPPGQPVDRQQLWGVWFCRGNVAVGLRSDASDRRGVVDLFDLAVEMDRVLQAMPDLDASTLAARMPTLDVQKEHSVLLAQVDDPVMQRQRLGPRSEFAWEDMTVRRRAPAPVALINIQVKDGAGSPDALVKVGCTGASVESRGQPGRFRIQPLRPFEGSYEVMVTAIDDFLLFDQQVTGIKLVTWGEVNASGQPHQPTWAIEMWYDDLERALAKSDPNGECLPETVRLSLLSVVQSSELLFIAGQPKNCIAELATSVPLLNGLCDHLPSGYPLRRDLVELALTVAEHAGQTPSEADVLVLLEDDQFGAAFATILSVF